MDFDFRPVDLADEAAFTVAELNRRVKGLLERQYDRVWVEAEVAELTRARSGHLYFTLADADGKAQIGAVMWKGMAMRYGRRLEAGAAVRCQGRLTLYEARGSYQLVVDRVDEAGAGVRARQLAELKERLAAEGLFALERKRPLPAFPRCVGVVTSRDGAALRDIIKVTSRRFPVRLLLAHAQVQGAAAPREIVEALERVGRAGDVDVVIVGRGGGASEDLDAFNDEGVVRAVVDCPHPVVAAVGHETDTTLVDLAADRRAATPSEAAEIVVPDAEALRAGLERGARGLARTFAGVVALERARLAEMSGRLRGGDPRLDLKRRSDTLARCREALERWPSRTLTGLRGDLALAEEPLARWPERPLAEHKAELARMAASMEALSPLGSLSRGYAVVQTPAGEIVTRASQAPVGSRVEVTLARGRLRCEVEESREGATGETTDAT
jgi:exodeoxyribonuclease VII large subunit